MFEQHNHLIGQLKISNQDIERTSGGTYTGLIL
jgi:hypothetical protein